MVLALAVFCKGHGDSNMNAASRDIVLKQVLDAPTAPFNEHAVIAAITQWADIHRILARSDKWGNLLLEWTGDRPAKKHSDPQPTWVFAAHMDHPGFVVRRVQGLKVWADFMGGVRDQYFAGARVAFHTQAGAIKAVVKSIKHAKGRTYPQAQLELAHKAPLAEGTLGMWDFPAMVIRDSKLSARACDDVVGCATILCALEEIINAKLPNRVLALFTRAEEVGFVGAMAACQAKTLPTSSLVVSIETSKAQPAAPLGSGAVVRVGDASRTFDPALTAMVAATAVRLASQDKQFKYSRQLMPGGVCESTAYMAWGYRTTGLCLPLENYHNMGPGNRIAPERVSLQDFDSLVKLLVAIAQQKPDPAPTDAALKQRLDTLFKERSGLLVK